MLLSVRAKELCWQPPTLTGLPSSEASNAYYRPRGLQGQQPLLLWLLKDLLVGRQHYT